MSYKSIYKKIRDSEKRYIVVEASQKNNKITKIIARTNNAKKAEKIAIKGTTYEDGSIPCYYYFDYMNWIINTYTAEAYPYTFDNCYKPGTIYEDGSYTYIDRSGMNG